MPNPILDDLLSDSGLPGVARRALRARADELKAAEGLDDKAAARKAIEEFHGYTKDDLQATLDALKEAPLKI